jgi:hypothetical protein
MRDGMKMSSVLGASNRACADIKLEDMSLLRANPKQESSVDLRESGAKFHARHFRIFDTHILRVQVERRYLGQRKVIYLDMMMVAHNHMRTGKRNAPSVRMHVDLGLRVSIAEAKRRRPPRGCAAIWHQVDSLNFLLVFVT